jgi:hypothetical protein
MERLCGLSNMFALHQVLSCSPLKSNEGVTSAQALLASV